MADKTKLTQLQEELTLLEKELERTTTSIKAKITRKRKEIDAENVAYLNAVGAEWMGGKTRFFAGRKLLNMEAKHAIEMRCWDLIMITSGPKIGENGNHKYTIYDCVKIDPCYGNSNTLTTSVTTIDLQSLRSDMENIPQEVWVEIYQRLQREMLSSLLDAVKDIPELSTNPLLLIQDKSSL